MRKKFIKLVTILITVWLLFGSMTVYAYDPNIPFDGTVVASWTQGAWPECKTFIIGGTSTIQRAACGYFATSYALVKAGLMDPSTGDAPIQFIKKIVQDGNTDTEWGHFKMTTINQYYPEVTCKHYMLQLMNSGKSLEESLDIVKGFYNEGKFVIIDVAAPGITNGHYVFVDGYKEDGTMIIGDSGYGFTDFQPYLDAGVTIKYCTVYDIEGKDCSKLASIYSDTIGEATEPNSGSEMDSEEQEVFESFVKEMELNGMGKFNYESPADLQEPVLLPYAEQLSISQQANISSIGENIDSRKISPSDFFHALSVFSGICFMIYGVLLLLAYITDYNNTFITVSLLKIISFGRFKVLKPEDEKYGVVRPGYNASMNITYLSAPMIAKRVIFLVAIGLFLISGVLNNLLINIIFFVQDTLSTL